MAKNTEHYGLVKPAQSDFYNVDDFNGNADIIDSALQGKVDKVSGKGLSANDYTTAEKAKVASVQENLNSHIANKNNPHEVHPVYIGALNAKADLYYEDSEVIGDKYNANWYQNPGARVVFGNDNSAQSCTNLPSKHSGHLCIYFEQESEIPRIQQHYITSSGVLYVRRRYTDGAWQQWQSTESSGMWTPKLTINRTGAIIPTINNGSTFYRTGKLVLISFNIFVQSIPSSPEEPVFISGLPYPSIGGAAPTGVYWYRLKTSWSSMYVNVDPNDVRFHFWGVETPQTHSASPLMASDLLAGGATSGTQLKGNFLTLI